MRGSLFGFFLTLSAPAISFALTGEQAAAASVDAYIYGYPLVTMEMTRRVMTNAEISSDFAAPMGQFAHARSFPTASFKEVVAPNVDTLYSTAWLDLSKEPYILHVPDEKERYYLIEILSAWTNVFASLGTRTTGTKAADFALCGPNWKGSLPSGVQELRSPTNLAWIIGRTYCTGTPVDYDIVHKIQDQYKLTPLSAYKKPYTPPQGTIDPSIDRKTAVRDQVNALSAKAFFSLLLQLMKENPAAAEDAPILAKMAEVDLVSDKAAEAAPKRALAKIAQQAEKNQQANGWRFSLDLGNYGTNYLQRAFIASSGLGANLPEDAIYLYALADNRGNPLDASKNRYVIDFPKGGLPPVEAFWSVTLYDQDYFFFPNPLGRYSLSARDRLTFNGNGSLTLYIEKTPPAKERLSNWIPAPEGKFILMLRLYWPREEILKGSWQPPQVLLVE